MKKQLIFFCFVLIFIINNLNVQHTYAYSYGDPGEEQLAEAYKELAKYVEEDDWEKAKAVYLTYQKEFDLYFTKTKPLIEKAFEEKDKDLLLKSYQYALLLNIERRLHFAEDQFDDYGQAKLLLAKARGTFSVLEPILVEKTNQETADKIYHSFDEALTSLGNPGLFGIGSQSNDPEAFKENVAFINQTLKENFKLPSEENEDNSHLTEENLDFLNGFGEDGNSAFWAFFSALLVVILAIIIISKKLKDRKK